VRKSHTAAQLYQLGTADPYLYEWVFRGRFSALPRTRGAGRRKRRRAGRAIARGPSRVPAAQQPAQQIGLEMGQART